MAADQEVEASQLVLIGQELAADLHPTNDVNEANLVSSLATNGMHYPAIDIDIPCRLVQSSTEGHGHLYFDDLALTWPQYDKLLAALVEAGIVDEAYHAHSRERAMTLVRPPWVRKPGHFHPPVEANDRFKEAFVCVEAKLPLNATTNVFDDTEPF